MRYTLKSMSKRVSELLGFTVEICRHHDARSFHVVTDGWEHWYSTQVCVATLNELTPEMWADEIRELKEKTGSPYTRGTD